MFIVRYWFRFLCVFSVIVETFVPRCFEFSNVLVLCTEYTWRKIDSPFGFAIYAMFYYKFFIGSCATKAFAWCDVLTAYVTYLAETWTTVSWFRWFLGNLFCCFPGAFLLKYLSGFCCSGALRQPMVFCGVIFPVSYI